MMRKNVKSIVIGLLTLCGSFFVAAESALCPKNTNDRLCLDASLQQLDRQVQGLSARVSAQRPLPVSASDWRRQLQAHCQQNRECLTRMLLQRRMALVVELQTKQRFSDYPAAILEEASAPRLLSSSLPEGAERLLQQKLLSSEVELAGYYSQLQISCGEACQKSWLLNLRTGRLLQNPFNSECPPRLLGYQPDSRLLVAELPSEQWQARATWQLYVLDADRLTLLHTVELPWQSQQHCQTLS